MQTIETASAAGRGRSDAVKNPERIAEVAVSQRRHRADVSTTGIAREESCDDVLFHMRVEQWMRGMLP